MREGVVQLVAGVLMLAACGGAAVTSTPQTAPGPEAESSETAAVAEAMRFGNALDFMRKHIEVVVLSDAAGQAQVAVAPEYQGRVMDEHGERGGRPQLWLD